MHSITSTWLAFFYFPTAISNTDKKVTTSVFNANVYCRFISVTTRKSLWTLFGQTIRVNSSLKVFRGHHINPMRYFNLPWVISQWKPLVLREWIPWIPWKGIQGIYDIWYVCMFAYLHIFLCKCARLCIFVKLYKWSCGIFVIHISNRA